VLKRQNFFLFSLIIVVLLLNLGREGYAMDKDDEHNPTPQVAPCVKDDGLDTEEAEGSEEIVDVRASIIKDVKAAMPQYQEGDLGIMRWVNKMCKEYKITQEELGVASHQWSQDPKEVSKLPLKERFAAIQKVTPDDRWTIPKILREEVFRFELSKVKDPKERAAKTDTLKSQLALHVYEFTNSQEEAHNETLPSLLNESAYLGRQLMVLEIKKERLLNEGQSEDKKRKLTFDTSTSDNVAKKVKEDIVERDFQKLTMQEKILEESRKKIIAQQVPLVEKVTRNSSNGNFKN
jgi:hypothetical protein